jgi:hypothetical protein
MKGDLRINSGTKFRGRIYKRKLSSIFENLKHHPHEGFNCSVEKFTALKIANGAIKASVPSHSI